MDRKRILKETFLIIAGIVALWAVVAVVTMNIVATPSYDLFDAEGDCLSEDSFEVFQVNDAGNALAQGLSQVTPTRKHTKLIVLFMKEEGQEYHKGQVIEIPPGNCAKQIGVYKYMSKKGKRSIPIAGIREN